MRVLIAHGRYRQPGGEERHVELLEQGLRAADADVRLFLRGPAGTGLREKAALAAGLAYRPSAARDLSRELERRPADVVHFHNLVPHLTPAVLRAAKRSGAVVVLTVHNYRFACPAGSLVRGGRLHEDCIEGSSLACGLRKARDSWVESIAYGLALEIQRRLRLLERWVDAFVAPSAFVARTLVRAGLPGGRVHVIANGVPLDASLRRARDAEHVLYAGRLTPEKGLGTLLEATRRASGRPRLVVAGSGPLEASVCAATAPAVSYAGNLRPGALAALRTRAVFAVVPSEVPEALPYSALEALAAGVPVVASRIGGMPEIVADGVNGLLVPPGDPNALARALDELWNDRERAAVLGEAARTIAAERFSLEGQTARLLDLYADLRSAA